MNRAIFRIIGGTYLLSLIIYLLIPASVTTIHWQPTESIHIHHYFYGFMARIVIGFITLVYNNFPKRLLAVIYGLSLFLVMDEFNMWLKFREDTPDPYEHLAPIIVLIIFLALYLLDKLKKSP